ncbi:MAG: potassium channel family protein [Hyphomonadaceae bacterium]
MDKKADPDARPRRPVRSLLRELYHGETSRALRFQAMWLFFDALLIAFFMVSPFIEHGTAFLLADYAIALVLFADLVARAWAFGNFTRWIARPLVWADFAVLLSLIIPVYAANLGFLRILRAYSLIHGASLWRLLGPRVQQHSDSIKAVFNLVVFIFMMTALVHTLFAGRVPHIKSYLDSLYFTVASLTTTGYGDIVLPGVWGRLISVLIMIGGVSLFFRLVQVAIRSPKVRAPCPSCGLQRHEPDAIHCKACGQALHIPHDND